MDKNKNLPNLSKQISKVIGKLKRDSKKIQDMDMNGSYEPRKDPSLYEQRWDALAHKPLYITKSWHRSFVRLLEMVQKVFDAENVEYDINQIEDKLDKFIANIVLENKIYNLEMINEFVEQLKEADKIIYFFRLIDFDYEQKINLGSNIVIISGKEILDDIPEFLNQKAEESPKIKNIIQKDDILLGVSVNATGRSDKGYYHALDVATRVNNLINFLNGFNHKPSQVLELNKHVVEEDGFYQFMYKSEHFATKQTPGTLKGGWSSSSAINPDQRSNADMNFDKRWLKLIPAIINEASDLSPLQKQCARAIDWIGDGIVNSNQTKQFLQIMISLETMIEQDPDRLESKLKKDNLWKDNLPVSIEKQFVSIVNLLCYKGVEEKQLKENDKAIKSAYDLRSRISHDGEILTEDATHLLDVWYGLAYTIISRIMFSSDWDNVYDLWKAANIQ
ncbi:hypothetical protein [Lactobacillus sp. PSON]|uniref:hypothetical protein n=1 Tax=Lactobacillus sp. PSON TaxID=3455454 RepID=UPI004042A965